MNQYWDIEADWNLDLFCNYHCTYCISRSNKVPILGQEYLNKIFHFFSSRKLKWHLHFTGGEPFHYPNFMDIVSELHRNHYISINTNLSSDKINTLIEQIDLSKIVFINAGIHIEELEKSKGVDDFIWKVRALEAKGVFIFVSYVLTPKLFFRFESDFNSFLKKGIVLIPKVLRSTYNKQIYPLAYTEFEREKFIQFHNMAMTHLKLDKQANYFDEEPLINLTLDKKFIHGIPTYHGRSCLAGKRFVRIWEDGIITKCDKSGDTIGNIFNDSFQLRSNEEKCNTYSCPYFCEKYTKMAEKQESKKI